MRTGDVEVAGVSILASAGRTEALIDELLKSLAIEIEVVAESRLARIAENRDRLRRRILRDLCGGKLAGSIQFGRLVRVRRLLSPRLGFGLCWSNPLCRLTPHADSAPHRRGRLLRT